MNRSSKKVLLLNASNMDGFPVYPYAFIQVPAVARQAGVEVICKDLLGIPQERWEQTILSSIQQYDPAMILITLRNTDSLKSEDYEQAESKVEAQNAYFPIERTRQLIATIREVSKLKIAVGGFGFSLLPKEIMQNLRPDFGVFGGPDAFFAHFEDIEAGELENVDNLLYFQNGQLISNPLNFFLPLASTEYTPEKIADMLAFYDSFPSPGFLGAPVEIMRGCIHNCVFCSEPHVAGHQVRYRDLSAVLGDIEILVDHGITQIYIISSELNPEGNEFILQLADKIFAFNEKQLADRKVTWFGANYLLKFSLDEYERLSKSGFTGGWFDITALDDENARAMRTPYRNSYLLTDIKTYIRFERNRLKRLRAPDVGSGAIDSKENTNLKERAIKWTLFLGNPATTTKTIHNTLRTANQEGLAQQFNDCYINKTTRVFEYENPDQATYEVTYSVTPDLARTGYQQILPSFAYSPALLKDFGSADEIIRMFDHIAETYLSVKYQNSRDWHSFIKQKATLIAITSWLAGFSDTLEIHKLSDNRLSAQVKVSQALQVLFSERPQDEEIPPYQILANQVVNSLLFACMESFPGLLGDLGFPTSLEKLTRMTPYELAVAVFSRWSTEIELVDGLMEHTKSVLSESEQEFIRFSIQAILYRFNVIIDPKYKELFVSDGLAGKKRE